MRAMKALVVAVVVMACGADEAPTPLPEWVSTEPLHQALDSLQERVAAEAEALERAKNTGRDAALASRFSYGARPSECERFDVVIDEDGRRRFNRIRKPWGVEDRKRFRKLVGLVANEMGADPRLFQIWALRESTYRPSSLHVLNPDIEGATASWRKYSYDPREEKRLEQILESAAATSSAFWEAKGRLAQVRTFKDNPFLDARIEYTATLPNGVTEQVSGSAWAMGYGPFGFNPTYFLPLWDARSPPWVFCHDDGLIAIVTAVWNARVSQRQCERAGVGGSYAVVNCRFGRGHCCDLGPEAKFRRRAQHVGLDANARARLGRKWKRRETDRDVLLSHLRERAVQAGLLPATVLPSG